MSKLNSPTKLPEQYRKSDFFQILTQIDNQVNGISEGRIAANYNAATAIPAATAVASAQGDKVWKSNTSVQGTVGAQFVTLGWVCTVGGTPGTWVEMRTLTGT